MLRVQLSHPGIIFRVFRSADEINESGRGRPGGRQHNVPLCFVGWLAEALCTVVVFNHARCLALAHTHGMCHANAGGKDNATLRVNMCYFSFFPVLHACIQKRKNILYRAVPP